MRERIPSAVHSKHKPAKQQVKLESSELLQPFSTMLQIACRNAQRFLYDARYLRERRGSRKHDEIARYARRMQLIPIGINKTCFAYRW